MTKQALMGDLSQKKIAIIYKKSRFDLTKSRGSAREQHNLRDQSDSMVQDLKRAHANNLSCIEKVKSVVEDLGLPYRLLCRSDLEAGDLDGSLVVSVGGDGTLLDASHYCDDAAIVGVNSDPEQSIGALCIATATNFKEILLEILANKLLPSVVMRLAITINGREKKILALNDVLYCHHNPAATSRYYIAKNDGAFESQRSSGVWVATPAGSTGGIYSCGGPARPILDKEAIFRVREPYWADNQDPLYFFGTLAQGDMLRIRSNMSEAHCYVDGPHKSFAIPLGEEMSIALADKALLLYDGLRLEKARTKAIEQRRAYRRLFKDDES